MLTKYLAIFLVVSIQSLAQTITGDIQDAQVVRIGDGVFVCGFKGKDATNSVEVVKYDLSLKKIAEYSRKISPETSKRLTEFFSENGGICCVVSHGGTKGEVIRLNKDLKEIAYKTFEKKDYKAAASDAEIWCPKNYPFDDENTFPVYHYKDKVMATLFRGMIISEPSDKYPFTGYKKKYFIQTDTNRKVDIAYQLYADDNVAIGYQNVVLGKNGFDQHLVCADMKTGALLFSEKINETGKSILVPSNAIADETGNTLFVVGCYSDITNKKVKEDVRHDGFFLLTLTRDGKVVSLEKKPYPDYPFTHFKKDDKEVLMRFHKVLPSTDGNFIVFAENYCFWKMSHHKESGTTNTLYVSFGFTCFEFTKNGKILGTSFTERLTDSKSVIKGIGKVFSSFFLYPNPEAPNGRSLFWSQLANHPEFEFDSLTGNAMILYYEPKFGPKEGEPLFYYKKSKGCAGGSVSIVPGVEESKNYVRCFLGGADRIFQCVQTKDGYTLTLVKI